MKTIKYIINSIFIGVFTIFIFNFIGQFVNLKLSFLIFSICFIGFFRLLGFIVLFIYTEQVKQIDNLM